MESSDTILVFILKYECVQIDVILDLQEASVDRLADMAKMLFHAFQRDNNIDRFL